MSYGALMGEVTVVEFMLRHSQRRVFIDAVRPGIPQVGERLRRIHEELVRGVGGDPPDRWEATPPLTPDVAWHHGLSDDEQSVVLEIAHVLTTAVKDHLLALAILAEGNAPTRSLLAMSRVLLDASCKLQFVLKRGLQDKVRVIRAANLALDSLREEANDRLGDDRGEVLQRRDELRVRLVRCGYHATKDGSQLKPGLDAVTIQKEAGEDGPVLFRLASSSIHGVERSWIRSLTGADLIGGDRAGHRIMLPFWVGSLDVTLSAILSIQSFYGLRGDPLETATVDSLHEHIAVAGGERDDDIWAMCVAEQPALVTLWDPEDPPRLPST